MIISPAQLIQLLLVLLGGLALHFKEVVFQEKPAAGHKDRILTLLQKTNQILLIKGSNCSQSSPDQDSTVICVYIARPDGNPDHCLDPGALRDNCIVFGLSRAHRVYHPTQQLDVTSSLKIQDECDGLSLHVQSLKCISMMDYIFSVWKQARQLLRSILKQSRSGLCSATHVSEQTGFL